MLKLVDDLEREIYLARAPKRLVSLVPSDTHTLFALGVGDRVVGRTRYCAEPAGEVADIPTCGGTKDVDVARIVELAPDLVLANHDENPRPKLEEIAQAGIAVAVSHPCTVFAGMAHIARLVRALEIESSPTAAALLRDAYRAVQEATAARAARPPLAVFAPIWLDPLMTFADETFADDLLRLAGARNVFGDHDPTICRMPAVASGPEEHRRRYPEVAPEEIAKRAPEAVLLPDEPFAFSDDHARELCELATSEGRAPAVARCDGKDLFWYGAMTTTALARMTAVVDSLRGERE